IRGLAGDHTVLLSTHILAEVSMVCTRVAIIHRGRVVAQDTIANLTGSATGGDRFIIEVVGPAALAATTIRAVEGVGGVESLGEIGRAEASAGATRHAGQATEGPADDRRYGDPTAHSKQVIDRQAEGKRYNGPDEHADQAIDAPAEGGRRYEAAERSVGEGR